MKLIKKILFLVLCLTSIFNLKAAEFPGMNPEEMAKLEEMAKKMLDSMTPEEQEKIMQEALAMDQHIKSLPEEERIKQLKKIDEGVKFIMSPDFPLDEILKTEAKKEEVKQPEAQEQQEPQEQKVQECKVAEPVYRGSTMKIKDTLNNLISKISTLLVKVKAMPRVASEKEIENRWAALQSPLTSLESLFKIVLKKEKLLNALNYSEYNSLKSNFESLNNKLERFQIDKKDSKFKVPDTAGLTISYDEEEEDPEFETAQKLLKEIIFIFEDSINKNVLGLFIDFMQKNAPEELKNNPEIAKALEADNYKVPAPSSSSGSTYGNYGGYNNSYAGSYGGSYGPYNYPIIDDSSAASSGLNPITPAAQTPPAPKDAGKSKSEGDKAKKEKEGEQKKSEGKKDKPKGSGDEKEIKSKINSFSRTLENVSKSLGNSPIPETISKIKGTDKEVKETKEAPKKRSADDEQEPTTIDDVKADYDKAVKLAKEINQSLENLSGKTKESYKEVVKEVYQRPEFKLEETYSDYLALSKKLEDDLVKNPEDLAIQKKIEESAALFDIMKKHKKLRSLSGFKDKEDKEKSK